MSIHNFPGDALANRALDKAVADGILTKVINPKGEDFFSISKGLSIEDVLTKIAPRVRPLLLREGKKIGIPIEFTEKMSDVKALRVLLDQGLWENPIMMIVDLYIAQ